MLHAVVLTQYRRVTDEQTDGIAIASIVLAIRALQRTVKSVTTTTTTTSTPQPFTALFLGPPG